MKKAALFLLVSLLFFLNFRGSVWAADDVRLISIPQQKIFPKSNTSVKSESVIVFFKNKPSVRDLIEIRRIHPQLTLSGGVTNTNAVVFQTGETDFQTLKSSLSNNPAVASAIPNDNLVLMSITNDQAWHVTPSPGQPGLEWHYLNTKAAAFPPTQSAWDITTGSVNVVVAVIDSGVDSTHPDLSGKFASLIDCGTGTCQPVSILTDGIGHGTHVAGLIAAATNNSIGVAGTGYNTRLMPLKIADAAGNIPLASFVNAVTYAADHGVRVINISLGAIAESISSEELTLLSSAVQYAWNKGVVIVSAAGNCGGNTQGNSDCSYIDSFGNIQYAVNSKFYPGALPNVVSVAALTLYNTLASYSEHNDTTHGNWITLSAPGGDSAARNCSEGQCIASLWPVASGQSYSYDAGTSMASPLVAGTAALIMAVNPGLSNSQVVSILESTAQTNIATGSTNYGLVNAYGAVQAAQAAAASPTPTTTTTPNNPTATSVPSVSPTAVPSPTSTVGPSPTIGPTLTPSATTLPSATPLPSVTPLPTQPPMLRHPPPEPYPDGPYCPVTTSCQLKDRGDADCNGVINANDFAIWLTQFDTMVTGQTINHNANFSCQEVSPVTYFIDLNDFEAWRRFTSSGLFGQNPTATITVPTPTLSVTPTAVRTPTPSPTVVPTVTASLTPTPGAPTITPSPRPPTLTPTRTPTPTPESCRVGCVLVPIDTTYSACTQGTKIGCLGGEQGTDWCATCGPDTNHGCFTPPPGDKVDCGCTGVMRKFCDY